MLVFDGQLNLRVNKRDLDTFVGAFDRTDSMLLPVQVRQFDQLLLQWRFLQMNGNAAVGRDVKRQGVKKQ